MAALAAVGAVPREPRKLTSCIAAGLYEGRQHNVQLHPAASATGRAAAVNINLAYATGRRVVLLDQLCVVQDILEHTSPVICIEWASSAGLFAVATDDHTVHVYSPVASTTAATEDERARLTHPPTSLWHHAAVIYTGFPVQTLAWLFREDNLCLLVGGTQLCVWQVETDPAVAVREIVWHAAIDAKWNEDLSRITVSPDGRLVAALMESAETVVTWDMAAASTVSAFQLQHRSLVQQVQWYKKIESVDTASTLNVLLCFCSDGFVYLWKQNPFSASTSQGAVGEPPSFSMYCALQFNLDAVISQSVFPPGQHEQGAHFTTAAWIENTSHRETAAPVRTARPAGTKTQRITFQPHSKKQRRKVVVSPQRRQEKEQRSGLHPFTTLRHLLYGQGSPTSPSVLSMNEFLEQSSPSIADPSLADAPSSEAETSSDDAEEESLFGGRHRLYSTDALEPETSSSDDLAWILALDSEGSARVLCIERLFAATPGGARVLEYAAMDNVMEPAAARREAAVSLRTSARFVQPFSWIHHGTASSYSNAPVPCLIRTYLVSGTARSTSLRSWAIRVNERKAQLIAKCTGHRSKVLSVRAHPVLPYVSTLDDDGLVLLWKLDFPHYGSALDQQHGHAGMQPLYALDRCFKYVTWFPSRTVLALVCLAADHSVSLHRCGEEHTVESFPRIDQEWSLVWSHAFPFDVDTIGVDSVTHLDLDTVTALSVQTVVCVSNPSSIYLYSMKMGSNVSLTPLWTRALHSPLRSIDIHPSISWLKTETERQQTLHMVLVTQTGDLECLYLEFNSDGDAIASCEAHALMPRLETPPDHITVCDSNLLLLRYKHEIQVWEFASVGEHGFRRTLCVTATRPAATLAVTRAALGDGLLRLVTAESFPGNLTITVHMPQRVAVGRTHHARWKSIDLDVSRFVHRFHRFARLQDTWITNLQLTSYGSLVLTLNNAICYIPSHCLFLVQRDTCVVPLPLYAPSFLNELLLLHRLPAVKRILGFLSKAVQSATIPSMSIETALGCIGADCAKDLAFGHPEQETLSSYLVQSRLPYLTGRDNLLLLSIAENMADMESQTSALDPCGMRFYTLLKNMTLDPAAKAGVLRPLPSFASVLALHSCTEASLLALCLQGARDWSGLQRLGIGFWVTGTQQLTRVMEGVAAAEFQKRRNPLDAMLFYLALGKVKVLLGLFRAMRDQQQFAYMHRMLSQDLDDPAVRDKATDVAFGFLRKRKFRAAIAFLLLAQDVAKAVQVATRNLGDAQLGIVLCRLLEPELLPPLLDSMLEHASTSQEPWMEHIALWLHGKRDKAVLRMCQLQQRQLVFRPDLLFLVDHLSSEGVLRGSGVSSAAADASVLHPEVRVSIELEAAHDYNNMGWPLLALERVSAVLNAPDALVHSIVPRHTATQLHHNVVLGMFAMRAALKPRSTPAERQESKKKRNEAEASAPRDSNPFGFSFVRLDQKVSEPSLDQVDSSGDTLLEEVALVKTMYGLDTLGTVSQLSRYVRAHHLFLHYLDLQIDQGHASAIFGFVQSELDSFASLAHTSNLFRLPRRTSIRIIVSCNRLASWKSSYDACSDGNNSTVHQVAASLTLPAFLRLLVLSALVSLQDYTSVVALLRCSTDDERAGFYHTLATSSYAVPETGWVEQYRFDYGDYVLLEEPREDDDEMMDTVARSLLHLYIARYALQGFHKQYMTSSDRNVYSDPNFGLLQNVYHGILTWQQDAFDGFPDTLNDGIQHCIQSAKAHIRLSDVLAPLQYKRIPGAADLVQLLQAASTTALLAQEITSVAKQSMPQYGNPIQVYHGVSVPMGIAFNSNDAQKLAIGTTKGLLEINIESAVRFRMRSHDEEFRLLDAEFDTWEGALHRFNQEEAEGYPTAEPYLYPRPRSRSRLLSCSSPWTTSQLPSLNRISCFTDPLYKSLTSHLNDPAAAGHDRIGSFSCLQSHPRLPMYLANLYKHDVLLYEYDWPTSLHCYDSGGMEAVSQMRFSGCGSSFAVVGSSGQVSLYSTGSASGEPIEVVRAHSKAAWDVAFLDSATLLATAGSKDTRGNVRIHDMLSPPSKACVMDVTVPSDGHTATALAYLPTRHMLAVGGSRGLVSFYDLRRSTIPVETVGAHQGRVSALVPHRQHVASAGVDGSVLIWSPAQSTCVAEYRHLFGKKTVLSMPGSGPMIERVGATALSSSDAGIAASGSDGSVYLVPT